MFICVIRYLASWNKILVSLYFHFLLINYKMEESLNSIQIHSSISTDLLLNVERLTLITPPHPSRSYFNTVEKFREKERELSESKKIKHCFVDKFYDKLKK